MLQLARLPATDDELWLTVRALFGVNIPRVKVCPDHVAPFTVFADIYFGRNSLAGGAPCNHFVIHASRGLAGKSFLLSTLGLTFAYLMGADINLLGGSMAQSVNIHEYIRRAVNYEDIPEIATDITATRVQLANGGRIRPIPASQRTVRGPHPPVLLMDEVDEMELDIYDAALGQPMPQKNYLGQEIETREVASSTWQYPDGTFSEVLRRAEEKDQPIYQWCYLESSNPVDGWLSQKTIADKRGNISEEMWRVEYDLGEPTIGNRAINTECVNATFCLDFKPIQQKVSKDFEEYRFEKPAKGGRYVVGADWGKEQDYTVIAVGRIDVRPHRLVYFLRVNRRPYPQMIGYFNRAMIAYHAQGLHDRTGLGNVVHDLVNVRAQGFQMIGQKRADMLTEYVAAIENTKWEFPRIPIAYREHKYASFGDLYSSASQFHLPDTVAAFALMHRLAKRASPMVAPTVVKRDDTPSKQLAQFEHHEPAETALEAPMNTPNEISLIVGSR